MFVLQKQLSVLNVPSSRVAKLYRSGSDLQLTLPDLPSQLASAFLVLLKGAGKVQVLVGLHLARSCCSIFYLSDVGEVAAEFADRELEAGLDFAESMGFVLEDIEFGRMTEEQQEIYWKGLPICRRKAQGNVPVADSKPVEEKPSPVINAKKKLPGSAPTADPEPETVPPTQPPVATARLKSSDAVVSNASGKNDMLTKRQVLKERLGRFLASL